MSSGSFCLRWDCFQRSFAAEFNTLRADGALVDITLCCDNGGKIDAHQLVLAACSPFFSELIKENKCQHMVFYMREVQPRILLSLVEFIYCGSVNVEEQDLNSFLRVAESLQIRGLSTSEPGEKDDNGRTPGNITKSNAPSTPELPIQPPSGNPEISDRSCVELTDANNDAVETVSANSDISPTAEKCERLDSSGEETISDPSLYASLQYCDNVSPVGVKRELPDEYTASVSDGNYQTTVSSDHEVVSASDHQVSLSDLSWHTSLLPHPLSSAVEADLQAGQQLQSSSSSLSMLSPVSQNECMYVCKYCGRRYGSRVSMLHHVKVHSGHTRCRLCHHVCSTVAHLRKHLARVHSLSADQISSLVPSRRINSISLLVRS